jgi:CheY-like chemotaxis protein
MERPQILVVEDQAILALGIGDLIASLGYRMVGPATSLAQALSLLETNSVHGALLDRDLGGESSDPLAHELQRRGVPFGWVTGARSAPGSSAPILRKPFTATEMQRLLDTLFAARLSA